MCCTSMQKQLEKMWYIVYTLQRFSFLFYFLALLFRLFVQSLNWTVYDHSTFFIFFSFIFFTWVQRNRLLFYFLLFFFSKSRIANTRKQSDRDRNRRKQIGFVSLSNKSDFYRHIGSFSFFFLHISFLRMWSRHEFTCRVTFSFHLIVVLLFLLNLLKVESEWTRNMFQMKIVVVKSTFVQICFIKIEELFELVQFQWKNKSNQNYFRLMIVKR